MLFVFMLSYATKLPVAGFLYVRISPMKYGAAFTRFVIAQKTQFYCGVTEGMGHWMPHRELPSMQKSMKWSFCIT